MSLHGAPAPAPRRARQVRPRQGPHRRQPRRLFLRGPRWRRRLRGAHREAPPEAQLLHVEHRDQGAVRRGPPGGRRGAVRRHARLAHAARAAHAPVGVRGVRAPGQAVVLERHDAGAGRARALARSDRLVLRAEIAQPVPRQRHLHRGPNGLRALRHARRGEGRVRINGDRARLGAGDRALRLPRRRARPRRAAPRGGGRDPGDADGARRGRLGRAALRVPTARRRRTGRARGARGRAVRPAGQRRVRAGRERGGARRGRRGREGADEGGRRGQGARVQHDRGERRRARVFELVQWQSMIRDYGGKSVQLFALKKHTIVRMPYAYIVQI
ncbi:hypothetical protein PVAP13_9NG192473 [Panicum virgatum]|uniref:Uncharacterized protein n=1 Tax=Panicum virgatum TaxID=38727 RepID=A0A8T0MGK7_PANVG|nr:hypothetical protein PVAP13_9NG192473 [Panicum virgatum]